LNRTDDNGGGSHFGSKTMVSYGIILPFSGPGNDHDAEIVLSLVLEHWVRAAQ